MIKQAAAALAMVFALPFTAVAQEGYEGPTYEVVETEGPIQVRAYDPMIVAEVTVSARNIREAASRGFRPLGNYIFGYNEVRQEIAMTAPVTSEPASATIAMTAPVTSEATEAGDFVVKFIMPSNWTMDTLPTPKDTRVRLVEEPGNMRVVLRYIGADGADIRATHEAALVEWVTARGYTITGPMIWAGYSSPSVPRNRRVFEVMLPVEPSATS